MSDRAAIALFQPDIPGNTGTILRMAACLGFDLHIIEPAGFRLDDKSLRRAGMDYLELATLTRHTDWESFCDWLAEEKRRLVLLSTQADQPYFQFDFSNRDCLIFGRESAGAPQEVHELADHRLTIPMPGEGRSLNLAVSVAMVAGEVLRQSV